MVSRLDCEDDSLVKQDMDRMLLPVYRFYYISTLFSLKVHSGTGYFCLVYPLSISRWKGACVINDYIISGLVLPFSAL